MRKCVKCSEEMIEGLSLVLDHSVGGLKITDKSVSSVKSAIKPNVAICKKCGHIELYTANLEGIEKFIK